MPLRPLVLSLFLLAAQTAVLAAEEASAPQADSPQAVFSLKTASPELAQDVSAHRDAFQVWGYRFDEEAGTLLSPQTKKPVTVAEVKSRLDAMVAGRKQGALERMHELLAHQPPGKPLPKEVIAELRTLAGPLKDGLPPSLLKALDAAETAEPAGLKAEAERAYLDSTRIWDGNVKLKDRLSNALPVKGGGWGSPPLGPSYFDETEKRLGDKLQGDIIAVFKKNPAGVELLEHFKDKGGGAQLPAVLVLKLDPKAGATYNPYARSIVVNYNSIMAGIVARTPEKDRPEVLRRLSDPRKFSAYLLENASARARFIEDNDVALFHELTHAWQDRRGRFYLETLRGNIPNMDPLEHEKEAFLNQNRYLHQKLLADPAAAMHAGWISGYQGMLTDFGRWENNINQTYLQNWPESAATMARAESIQKERIGVARKLMGESLYARLDEWLKIRGVKLGTEDVKRAAGDYRELVQRFKSEEYPRMRYDGYSKMGAYYDSIGRRDQAFFSLQRAEEAAARLGTKEAAQAQAQADKAMSEGLAWLKGAGAKMPIEEQVSLAGAIAGRVLERKKPWGQEEHDLVDSIYYQAAEKYYDLAKTTTGTTRENFLKSAENMASALSYSHGPGEAELVRKVASLKARIKAAREKPAGGTP